jgi:hypothetical protein
MQLIEITRNEDYKIFVDMDGVLVDFVASVKTHLIPDYTESKYKSDSKYRTKFWKAVKEFSEKGGKLWDVAPMMPDALQLLDYIDKHQPAILTASGNPKYGAIPQKHTWVKRHLSKYNLNVNIVRKSDEKAAFARPNHILIDDMDKSIGPWNAAGGIGILHTNTASTINKLKQLGI